MTKATNALRVAGKALMLWTLTATAPSQANIVLSQVIVDLEAGGPVAQDIEVWNTGTDRSFVVAEPVEVVSPGMPDEHRVTNPDPALSGLLVSPQRMILEPGQRKLVRIAAVVPRGDRDRIYRVAIKPVAGDVSAQNTALKVLVGYDILVIYRPETMNGDVVATRAGDTVTFRNAGNSNVEMFDGKQCDAAGKVCKDLPAQRLYAGASWRVAITGDGPIQYRIATAGHSIVKTF